MKKFLTPFNLYNLISFYVIWYLCILGAALGYIKIAVICSFALIVLHFFLTGKKKQDFLYIMIFLAIGLIVEKIFLYFSILDYPKDTLIWNIYGVPVWIIMLYLGFATTMNHSLTLMTHNSMLSFIFGSIGAGMCYYLASLRGIITFPYDFYSISIIGLYWGLFMISIKPMNLFFSKCFN